MRGKFIWLVVSGLMVLSLVMAACGPAPVEEEKGKEEVPIVKEEKAKEEKGAVEKGVVEKEVVSPEKPQYGGTLTYRIASDPSSFDTTAHRNGGALTGTVYQQLMGADWKRGPAGSGETNYAVGYTSVEDMMGPQLAESWEMPEQGVWILNIRQGVHWQPVDSDAGRLMGGREMTADDIVYNIHRHITWPEAWFVNGHPPVAQTASVEKTSPWEVTVRTPVEYFTAFSGLIQGSGFSRIQPPEVIEKYGDLEDWQNAVGTGPYMLVDYVPGSSFLYKRNPTYWETDPLGPGKGNQLPYPDALRELIIPDLSTTLAALRTGKLDLQTNVELIDAQTVISTSPGIEFLKYLGTRPWAIAMRQDLPDKPFADKRVRQALMLATDFEAFKRDYFGGEAEIDIWPVSREIRALYTPLSEMPESVQALYHYNPERAKELLAEAGYPDGFKTSVVIYGDPQRIDELSIFKDMWAKVGVDLEIDVKELGAYRKLSGYARNYDDMLYRGLFGSFSIQMYFSAFRSKAINNPSHVNDPPGTVPEIEELFEAEEAHIFIDMPKAYEAYKKLKPFVLEQAYIIPRPTPYTYTFWWPWLKNYYGQGTGLMGLIRYAWIDQDLKKEMGY